MERFSSLTLNRKKKNVLYKYILNFTQTCLPLKLISKLAIAEFGVVSREEPYSTYFKAIYSTENLIKVADKIIAKLYECIATTHTEVLFNYFLASEERKRHAELTGNM